LLQQTKTHSHQLGCRPPPGEIGRLREIQIERERERERERGDPADSLSPAANLCRPQVLSLCLSHSLSGADISLSLSLSLSLLSLDVWVMQGSEDRLDFESDFGFLLFWFDGRVRIRRLGDFGDCLVMRLMEDFLGIFWTGFHGGRKGKISPALKKFPVREKKKKKRFPARARKKIPVKKKRKKKEELKKFLLKVPIFLFLFFFFLKKIK
jgi:hypothetical protein